MIWLLGSRRGHPDVTAAGVMKLMGKLRSLGVRVNLDDEGPLLVFP